ncbi:MAG: hypothetical protein AAFQ43_01565 [Bacteroidota bacterium]
MLVRLFVCSCLIAALAPSMGCAAVDLPPEAAPESEPEPLAAVEIFRYADLGAFGRIVLGTPFAQRHLTREPKEDGGLRLRGRYMDTEGITVYVDEQNVVTQIRFDYDPAAEALSALSEAYTEILGPSTGGSRLGNTQRIEWQDPATRFELVSRSGDTPELYSVLADRALAGPSVTETTSQ